MKIEYAAPTRKTEITTLVDLVVFCENQLGWLPDYDSSTPVWRQRIVEASKLKRLMAKHQLTLDDLTLAARWAARTGHPVPAPTWLYGAVEKAREAAGAAAVSPSALTAAIEDAVSVELDRFDLLTDDWISRLLRAQGPARAHVLTEWRRQRGTA